MATEQDKLHVNGHVFSFDDLTYNERREIKRVARTEIWEEDVDGPFEDMSEDDLMPAIILVFMRRHDPKYTLTQAGDLRISDVFPDDDVPPTQPTPSKGASRSGSDASSKRSGTSSRAKTAIVATGIPS